MSPSDREMIEKMLIIYPSREKEIRETVKQLPFPGTGSWAEHVRKLRMLMEKLEKKK